MVNTKQGGMDGCLKKVFANVLPKQEEKVLPQKPCPLDAFQKPATQHTARYAHGPRPLIGILCYEWWLVENPVMSLNLRHLSVSFSPHSAPFFSALARVPLKVTLLSGSGGSMARREQALGGLFLKGLEE